MSLNLLQRTPHLVVGAGVKRIKRMVEVMVNSVLSFNGYEPFQIGFSGTGPGLAESLPAARFPKAVVRKAAGEQVP